MKNYFICTFGIFYCMHTCTYPQQHEELPSHAIAPKESLQFTLPKISSTGDILQTFLQPVEFSRHGINTFFTTIFNSTLYTERFLGSCFIHIVDFLDHGKNNAKPYSYFESVFNLFHHRLKESTWVNPYATLIFLDQLPEYIETMPNDYNQKLTASFKKELETILNDRAFLLKDRSDQFYQETAERMVTTLKAIERNGCLKDVQRSITLFLESALSKIIWNPQEQADIWKSITLIAQKCEQLQIYGCLGNTDDVNRLLWSLLYRFGYFIECAGGNLPLEFYQNIRDELQKEKPSFLTLEESEEWLVKKEKYLESVLMKGEIKAHAYKQGILSDIRI
jgi:hypothetical protein